MELLIYCDGGSRGNPGPSAYGFTIMSPDGVELEGSGVTIGHATNNVAEYSAVLFALQRARELQARIVHVRTDSKLLVEQLCGRYKVKNARLQELHASVRAVARAFERVTYTHVRREKNVRADELVNLALDGRINGRVDASGESP